MAKEEKENPFTRKDVLRLIEEHGGTAEGLDLSGKEFEDGIDLSDLNLKGIILNRAVLFGANFNGAHLEEADFSFARLEGASLWSTHLNGANFLEAHLEGVLLPRAHLGKANFLKAHLESADLSTTYLEEAWLWNAHLEGAFLYRASLSPNTKLENADWGNRILGEEREEQFDIAAYAYRCLKQWYTNASMYDTAAKFYYREKEANRKSLKLRSKDWHNRLAAEFMRVFFGYGEKWNRILIWIATVIFGLAGAYYFWGSFSSSSFLDTLYYSAASFTALGYGRWAPQPIGWAKGMGAAEAFMGVFMMALLLVTFVRKWTR